MMALNNYHDAVRAAKAEAARRRLDVYVEPYGPGWGVSACRPVVGGTVPFTSVSPSGAVTRHNSHVVQERVELVKGVTAGPPVRVGDRVRACGRWWTVVAVNDVTMTVDYF